MVHDILYKTKENKQKGDEFLSENLMLERILAPFIPESEKLHRLTEDLCHPLQSIENISYRREIFSDLYYSPDILSKLKKMLGSIKGLYDDINSQRRHRSMNVPLVLLKMRADSLKQVLTLFADLAPTARSISPKSNALKAIAERIARIGKDEENAAFVRFLEKIDSIRSDQVHNMEIVLNEHGKVQFCQLTDAQIEYSPQPASRGLRDLFSKPQTQPMDEVAQLNSLAASTDGSTLYVVALNTLSELMYDVEKMIFTEFLTAADQIDFYDATTQLFHMAEEKGISICFADLTVNDGISIKQLYNPLLTVLGNAPSPNDIVCPEGIRGIAITGGNNSGKTVFLRSLAVGMLMAYQGLPMMCKEAVLPLKCSMFSLFATSERTLSQNMGRFEQEVQRLSLILDEIPKDSVLILNEPFQTTEYEEGAQGLYGILSALTDIGVFWIVVTHLTDLGSRLYDDNNVLCLHMHDDHKLICK